MYMFIPVSEVFACLFDSKFLSFICCCFFFIVARNIRYQMSSFNENSAFGLIKHTCVELLAYPCMTYIVCIAWMCACWVVESVLCLWLLFVLSGPYFVILTNCAGVLKLFCDVIQRQGTLKVENIYLSRQGIKKRIDFNFYIKSKETVFIECSKLYYQCAKSFLQMAINLDMITS